MTSNSSQPERDFALVFPPMVVQNTSYHWVIISGLFDVVQFLPSALSLLHPSLELSLNTRINDKADVLVEGRGGRAVQRPVQPVLSIGA